MLLRQHLIDRLCAAGSPPLILISGPAGSGKTSLACQWLEQEKRPAAWYSLDKEDNEPDLFFRYLLTALIMIGQQPAKTLAGALTPQRELLPENVIPLLIEAVAGLSHDIRLVLDDFHHITNSDIQAGMARLLKYMPPRLQIVILSRYTLPAMVDAAVVKKDRMEIAAEDLKFTEKETGELFDKVMCSNLPADQISALNRHVEGWAAGLQLIGLSIRSKGGHPDLSCILKQAHEQVANYLIHDILQVLPQKIRDFVYATALLERFNPALCTEVTGMPDATEMLARLERMNLFLIPLDADGEWYRYHHMFSEVICRRIAIHDSDMIFRTLRKAALWLARNQHLEDALRMVFRSNDFEFAADLVEDHIMHYAYQFDLTTGLRWILKLPDSVLNQRALLRLQQCFFLLMMAPADVKQIIASIEQNGQPDFSGYSGEKLTLCQDYAALFKCLLHILYAGNAEAIAQFQALQHKCFPQSPLLAGAIELLMVFVLIANGELNVAETFLAKFSEVPLAEAGQLMGKKIWFGKANTLIALHRGQLRQAEVIIHQVLLFIHQQGCDDLPMAFFLHRHLGKIFYLQNRLEKARQCAEVSLKYCEHSGLMDEIMAGNELRVQLHLAAGENDQAVEAIRQMHALSLKLGMPQVAASADAYAARLAIDQGNLAAAELWSTRRKLRSDEPFSLLFASECLIQARLYYSRGQYPDAARLLETLRDLCVHRTLGYLVLQIDILYAATLHAMARHEKSLSLLRRALAFAETEGYIRPFVNDAGLIAPLLSVIAEGPPCKLSADYLEAVCAACHAPHARPAIPYRFDHPGHQHLSQREIEILEWMAQGFRNSEIAQKAFISINTVKSHVRKILVKLNAKTRTQAIMKARKVKILKVE